jgi:TRAP-type mannitol/chloroaromatic compound transport system permease small subunit
VRALARFVRLVEALTRAVGEVAAWLVLVVVGACAAVAVLRYGFGFGRIWLQELYVVASGLAFMLMAARAYAEDAHIRIDVVSRRWGPRTKALVEIAGCALFLLPWLGVVAWASWPFVRLSWMVREPSPQAGGLPGYYLVKGVIPLFAALLALQGLAAMARCLLVLRRREDLLPPAPRPAASAMAE